MREPFPSEILEIAMRILYPMILLFSFYVVIHGHTSPGGGFQGGAMAASGFILLRLTLGRSDSRCSLSRLSLERMAALSCFAFLTIAFLPGLFGNTVFDYSAVPLGMENLVHKRELLSFLAEMAIGFAVFSVFVLIYDAFVSQEKSL